MRFEHVLLLVALLVLAGCGTQLAIGPVEMRLEQDPESQRGEPGAGEVDGYPEEERHVGGPTDVDSDLARSFPKQDSVFGGAIPKEYFQWKEDLYEKTGVKLAISYQALFQKASDITANYPLPGTGEDRAAGGWLLIEAKWEAYNKGQDWQGGITATLDWRHGFGSAAEPAFWVKDTGSSWPTDFVYLEWDPWLPVAYWEQWGAKDGLVMRIGNQAASQIYDFFRFKDPRTSFSGSPFTVPAASMPLPPPGLAGSFEWWPVDDSQLYVVGTVNDMNAEVSTFSWGNAFDYGQFFYGLEIGNHWARGPGDFDHLHLNLFYGDERDTAPSVFPNKAGWGAKLAGEKQWGSLVGFGSYTYNTSQGGGFGATLLEHAVNAGLAYQKPFGVRGEAAVGGSWGRPIQQFSTGLPGWSNARDQYGTEAYWKILLTPDLFVTPGLQLIWDPSYAPEQDFLGIAQFKFRLFF